MSPEQNIEEAPTDFEPEVVEADTRPQKKVAIVGFTFSRELAPYDDPDFEIWACNNLHRYIKRYDRLYDLHEDEVILSDVEHEKYLRGVKVDNSNNEPSEIGDRPVFVWKARDEWPTSVQFPKVGILAAFEKLKIGRYFTNSIAWMIAHAVCEGASEIHVYGVDMATGTEYASQRPSCEAWLGFAEGLGIKVHIPDTSDLLKCGALYGTGEDDAFHAKASDRERELKARLTAIQQQQSMASAQQQELRDAQHQLLGALETTSYFRTVWSNPRANRDGSAKEAQDALPVGG